MEWILAKEVFVKKRKAASLVVVVVALTGLGVCLLSGGCGKQEAAAPVQTPPAKQAKPQPAKAPKPQPQGDGKLVVKGLARDLYDVFELKTNKKVHFGRTNGEVELPAGAYRVALNNSSCTVTVAPDQTAELQAGSVVVLGMGQDMYEVHGGAPSRKLSFTETNGVVELLPGDYKVGLHRVFQPIVVHPGKKTEVKAGTLLVKGPPKILYSVFDPTGKTKLDFRFTNGPIELLPRRYLVRVAGGEHAVDVLAGKQTVIEAKKPE